MTPAKPAPNAKPVRLFKTRESCPFIRRLAAMELRMLSAHKMLKALFSSSDRASSGPSHTPNASLISPFHKNNQQMQQRESSKNISLMTGVYEDVDKCLVGPGVRGLSKC